MLLSYQCHSCSRIAQIKADCKHFFILFYFLFLHYIIFYFIFILFLFNLKYKQFWKLITNGKKATTGIEPVTFSLRERCTTTMLSRLSSTIERYIIKNSQMIFFNFFLSPSFFSFLVFSFFLFLLFFFSSFFLSLSSFFLLFSFLFVLFILIYLMTWHGYIHISFLSGFNIRPLSIDGSAFA